MSKSDYYAAVGRPPETVKRLATGELRAAALPLFSPFFVHRSKVTAMRCSILLKPDMTKGFKSRQNFLGI